MFFADDKLRDVKPLFSSATILLKPNSTLPIVSKDLIIEVKAELKLGLT